MHILMATTGALKINAPNFKPLSADMVGLVQDLMIIMWAATRSDATPITHLMSPQMFHEHIKLCELILAHHKDPNNVKIFNDIYDQIENNSIESLRDSEIVDWYFNTIISYHSRLQLNTYWKLEDRINAILDYCNIELGKK